MTIVWLSLVLAACLAAFLAGLRIGDRRRSQRYSELVDRQRALATGGAVVFDWDAPSERARLTGERDG